MGFNFDFSYEQFKELAPRANNKEEWYEIVKEVLPKYDINTVERVAGFMSQCTYESADFSRLTENMNYSAKGLNKTFAKYFKRAGRDAAPYHRQPEKIANIVYANRMGNGNTASGDGWFYRGAGIIQLTGRNNHTAFGKYINMRAKDVPAYVRTKKGAMESACWFWLVNRLNRFCDAGDPKGLTRAINGGYHGLSERTVLWNTALRVLGSNIQTSTTSNFASIVRNGSKGEAVKNIQKVLGITADGDFGPNTEKAVKRWQLNNGLAADGVVGPKTMKKMLNV